SLPSPASPTTSMSLCASRNARSPCRTTPWSSAIRTRIFSLNRDLQVDMRAVLARLDAKATVDCLRTLLHRSDPKSRCPLLGRRGLEAFSIIFDLQADYLVLRKD